MKGEGWRVEGEVSPCLPDAEELKGKGGTGEGDKAKEGPKDAKHSQRVAEADGANEL